MRVNGTLYYVLKDHLGSASVVTDNSGTVVGDQRYYPFGETRLSAGTLYTDKLYTSQREMAGLGIYHYGARFYSPKIGRFLSADTMVPNPFNPQDYNRYSYVRNNPVRYIDPSGNIPIDCWGDSSYCSNTTTLPTSPYPSTPQRCTRNCGDPNTPIDDPDWSQRPPEERAPIVWNAICESGGWWGEDCPSETELVTWLLYEEGGTLYYDDQVNMAQGMRYRFAYFGNTPESFVFQLSGFTSFYNPDGDSDFDQSDWDALTNPQFDLSGASSIVNAVYSTNIESNDGMYLYWWDEREVVTNRNQWPGSAGVDYVQTTTVTGLPFYFTGIPNVQDCAMQGENCR